MAATVFDRLELWLREQGIVFSVLRPDRMVCGEGVGWVRREIEEQDVGHVEPEFHAKGDAVVEGDAAGEREYCTVADEYRWPASLVGPVLVNCGANGPAREEHVW